MSLYDDLDTDKKSENVSGWASGVKLLQSQMQLKKAAVTQPKRDLTRKNVSSLGPVIDFNKVSKVPLTNKDPDDDSSPMPTPAFSIPYTLTMPKHTTKKKGSNRTVSAYLSVDPEWQFDDEYDPLWPNDFDKALKDMRERREKEAEQEEEKRKTQDDLGDEGFPPPNTSSRSMSSGAGVAIAPPPSLSQSSDFDRSDSGGGSGNMGGGRFGLGSVGAGAAAAARIMAKYGYKEGQGLGKKEQGMSSALQVERITHRTGRIIHEKDLQKEVNVPNPFGLVSSMAAYNDINDEDDTEMFGPEGEEGTSSNIAVATEVEVIQAEQSLAELLKNPSKVVLLKNMVGPGEVDDDLEPEVKDECQTKYGPVNNVTIYQMPDMDEDAIRIFVEFEHEDSAEKALLDLNNRFFGGRQVKACFYDYSKYNNLELTE